MSVADRAWNVLFLCTGNSARSIMAEVMTNHLGRGRFRAFSAGSHPNGVVNPFAIEMLRSAGMPTAHWGVPDPAAAEGADADKRAAFRGAMMTLRRRIELLMALPLDKLDRLSIEDNLRRIATQ